MEIQDCVLEKWKKSKIVLVCNYIQREEIPPSEHYNLLKEEFDMYRDPYVEMKAKQEGQERLLKNRMLKEMETYNMKLENQYRLNQVDVIPIADMKANDIAYKINESLFNLYTIGEHGSVQLDDIRFSPDMNFVMILYSVRSSDDDAVINVVRQNKV